MAPCSLSGWAVAVAVHLVWGTQPVIARYLQTVAELDRWTLICATQAASFAFAAATAAVSSHISATPAAAAAARGGGRACSLKTKAAAGLGFGLLATCRAVTNFASSGFTTAWHISAVAMFGPFLTATMARLFLGERLKARSWPSACGAVAGGLLVVFAKARTTTRGGSEEEAERSPWSGVVAGCSLQGLSLCFSAGARVTMKATADHLSATDLMIAQYAIIVVATFLATAPSLGALWGPWASASPHAWAAAFYLAFVIQWLAAQLQVRLVRSMGPAAYTCLQPLRVVSTVAFDNIVLNEPVDSILAWAGLALVGLSVSLFLLLQAKGDHPSPTATAAAAAATTTTPDDACTNGTEHMGDDDDDGSAASLVDHPTMPGDGRDHPRRGAARLVEMITTRQKPPGPAYGPVPSSLHQLRDGDDSRDRDDDDDGGGEFHVGPRVDPADDADEEMPLGGAGRGAALR